MAALVVALVVALLLALLQGVLGQCVCRSFCSNLGLTSVPTCLASTITSLSLSYNKLSFIDTAAFKDLTRLESLYLQENAITSIADGAFGSLSNLVLLNLQTNQLSAVHALTFAGLTRLQQLILQTNMLTSIAQGGFGGLSSLQSLNLGSNNFAVLNGATFDGLISLQELFEFATIANFDPDEDIIFFSGMFFRTSLAFWRTTPSLRSTISST
eukprot:m.34847 g.34847  ORF g.34847 m.34847 type:complete len:213 (+) comp43730_c0_seq8:130-768(+)